jgi:hypothetical protein
VQVLLVDAIGFYQVEIAHLSSASFCLSILRRGLRGGNAEHRSIEMEGLQFPPEKVPCS